MCRQCSHNASRLLKCISSIDEKRLAAVVDEIKAAGGDTIGVSGDVGADDFPKKIVDATVQYVSCAPVAGYYTLTPNTQKIWKNQPHHKQR